MTLLLFLLRRLFRVAVSLLAVSIITFGLLQMAPGSFAGIEAAGGTSTGLAAAQSVNTSETLQADYGVGVPVARQYWNWLSGAVRGDLGPSYKYPSSSVTEIVGQALPVSASLAILAMALALVIAVPAGMLAAARKNSAWDYASMFATTVGVAIPNYLAAIALVLTFSVGLHWFPTGGWTGPRDLVLPVLALAAAPAGLMARYIRSSVLEVLREEYVVAALAKGGRRRVVMVRHVLRNSLIPLVTVAGPALAALMVGTIFIETVFGIPGLGQYFTQAAQARDMPLLMGCTMVFAVILMTMNLLVDLSYAVLDPRTRVSLGLASGPTGRPATGPDDPLTAGLRRAHHALDLMVPGDPPSPRGGS